MECSSTRTSVSTIKVSDNCEERRASSTISSHLSLNKRLSVSSPERCPSNVDDMCEENTVIATNQELESPVKTEEDVDSNDADEYTQTVDMANEEEEEKELLLQGSGSRADRNDDDDEEEDVAAAWLVLEKGKRLPTMRQTWREVHRQCHLGLPIAASNMMWFARFLVSTMFLRKLGGLQMAAGTLALTYANAAGWSVLVGLAGGIEAVCSQANGAGRQELLKLALRQGFMVVLMASIPIGATWCKAEWVLLLMGHNPKLARAAQSYLLYLLPDLLAASCIAPLRVFLRSQCITKPLMFCSLLALFFHISLNYLLVIRLRWGALGSAMAIWITDFAFALMLLIYVLRLLPVMASSCRRASPSKAIHESGTQAALTCRSVLKLAVPCCLITCMEGWSYEVMLLLTGLLPHASDAVETVAILLNGDTLFYALEMALASCVCTRVGNELGAKRPLRAYRAAVAALCVGAALGTVGAGWLLLSSGMMWGRFFTKDARLLKSVTQLVPIAALIEVANFLHKVACGVLRGSARPAIGASINMGATYLLGIPLAIILGLKCTMGLLGLWIALAAATAVAAILTVSVVLHTDWGMQSLRAHELTNQKASIEDSNCTPDEQPRKQLHAETPGIMLCEESLLSDKLLVKDKHAGDSKVELSNLKGLSQPLANRQIETEELLSDPKNDTLPNVEEQFVDGNWELMRTESGRQALGKSYSSGHAPSDGHCWEVSMSMMNESVRKCAMAARWDDKHSRSRRSSSPSQASGCDVKRNVFKKLKLLASQKSRSRKSPKPERRRSA